MSVQALEMPKRIIPEEDQDERLESILNRLERIITTKSSNSNGKKANIITACVAGLALMGAAFSTVASYGGNQRDVQRWQDDLKIEREARERLQVRFDKLRDMYMVQLGTDPEVATGPPTRRK